MLWILRMCWLQLIVMGLQYRVDVPRVEEVELPSNYISTTKYNIFTFLPLALLLQFKRYANCFFLVNAVLQSIPLISPLNPASAIAPLVFVVALSMLREGYEDYKRYRSDQKDNSEPALRYDSDDFYDTTWRELRPGDVIKVNKEDILPADFILLLSSEPTGMAYVETASLDGEKNLKPKFSMAPLQRSFNEGTKLPNFDELKGHVLCTQPSAEVESFEGVFEMSVGGISMRQRVNKKNMLLRGSRLKNVEWVAGMVVYTGENTVIMKNSSTPFTKISNIQIKVNNIILIILLIDILCCLVSAGYNYFNCNSNSRFWELLEASEPNCLRIAAISFGSYFILYSTFIPISLIVSLQFVKVFQGYFMSEDQEMYCALNQHALECRTVSINQQLGQIEYILTDKTGTLTRNLMEFKNIVIGTDIYGDPPSQPNIAENFDYQRLSTRYVLEEERNASSFDSRVLTYDLAINRAEEDKNYSKKQLIELAFFMICTCHECVPSGEGFEGPSPDEVALLKAAKQIGFTFLSCHNKVIKVEYKGKAWEFEQLKVFEFDSTRKLMSVVVRTPNGISVFVKGADTSIQKILTPNQPYLNDIRKKTEDMSRVGLRTLWFGYKTYPSTTDPDTLTIEEVESGLTLVSASGIQDRLQDFVPETIYSLRSGGIKLVMLTGDKLETAQNIALSCRLIEEGALVRNKNDLQALAQEIKASENRLRKSPVIDGSTLTFSESGQALQTVIEKSKSVVFCRVTPGQKAEIVRLVKQMGKLTLAIGDGANDVNMIMEANVGVGIFGEEGTRAAQVANYAIGEFCLLWKLVLYYGRLNYMRVTELILYFFYKNMVFTIIQFVYCFYTQGSGQSFWLSWSITFYNMIFTFLPVVLRAVFEIDIELAPTKRTFEELSKGTHENQTLYSYYPRMYYISQKNKLFTPLAFAAWFTLGVFQGVVCLVLTLYAIGDEGDTSGEDSHGFGFYLTEVSVYTSVIIVVTVKLAVNVKHWTVLLVLGFSIPSIGAYILYTFISGVFESALSFESMVNLLRTPTFYVIQFMCIGGMFSIDFFLFSLQSTKDSFENYLKFKTLKKQQLSENNLKEMMLEMVQTDGNRQSQLAPV